MSNDMIHDDDGVLDEGMSLVLDADLLDDELLVVKNEPNVVNEMFSEASILQFAAQRKSLSCVVSKMDDAFNNQKDARLATFVSQTRIMSDILEISLHDLVDALALSPREKIDGRSARGKMPPKYRSPDGDHEWSGMGRKPLWFEAAIEQGATAESMLINSEEE